MVNQVYILATQPSGGLRRIFDLPLDRKKCAHSSQLRICVRAGRHFWNSLEQCFPELVLFWASWRKQHSTPLVSSRESSEGFFAGKHRGGKLVASWQGLGAHAISKNHPPPMLSRKILHTAWHRSDWAGRIWVNYCFQSSPFRDEKLEAQKTQDPCPLPQLLSDWTGP